MSWMSQLYQTYENNAGKGQGEDSPLTPLAHMNAQAQIEVTLDSQSNFISAQVIEKGNGNTLIPVTESSAGRSSGKAPHSLCDTLSYIAGDYSSYCKDEDEKGKKNAEEKFELYISQLADWESSEYSHSKVKAIYQYLSKKELMTDLIKAGIVMINEQGVMEDKKVSGQPYEKAIVRFRVIVNDSQESAATWEDMTLVNAYINYYLATQEGSTALCYLTGKELMLAGNHPKGIVKANYNAKLVSVNDTEGFTYRGRFRDAQQAYALSYEASQKIHSALTWLADKQGVNVGTTNKRTFLCWNPKGKETPNILDPFLSLVDQEENMETKNLPYRKKLWKTLQGYQEQFDETDNVVIMALDAATKGRLSITYYNELLASDFLNRILSWGDTCRWYFRKYSEEKGYYYEMTSPVIRRIVECAFGQERGNYIEADDRVLKEQVQRLMKCMLDSQPLPRDIVHALVERASMPMAYSKSNRERLLSTTCAVISKYYYEKGTFKKGEENDMKLDAENRNRSYLFGRLLAVFEKVERDTYGREEKRDPNAIQLQAAYVNHPMQTWKTLEGALIPYYQKLNPGSRVYYKSLVGEIVSLFRQEDEASMNQGLKEDYLLGYYLQRMELYKRNTKEDSNNE